jgi:hypothetical protein
MNVLEEGASGEGGEGFSGKSGRGVPSGNHAQDSAGHTLCYYKTH